MTSRSGFAGTTYGKLNANSKVDSVPTSLHKNEEQEGMTTKTADSTYGETQGETSTNIITQNKQPDKYSNLVKDVGGPPMHQANLTKGKEIMGEHDNVPNIVRMEKKDNQPMTFKEIAEDAIDRPYHDILFMTGKEIMDEGELLVHESYIKMRTQFRGPESRNYVPRKRKMVKAAMKWKALTCPTTDKDELQGRSNEGPKTYKFLVNPYQSHHSGNKQQGGDVFVFGKTKEEIKQENQKPHSSNLSVGSRRNTPTKADGTPERAVTKRTAQAQPTKPQGPRHMGHIKKRHATCPRSRKMSPYAMRDQELKREAITRIQRKIANWNRRQQQTLGRNTKVLEGRELLRKKTSHKTKKKKRRIKKQKRDTTKVISRPTETIYTVEKDEPCILCLEKRQQSSPAVMFARLRSNRRYKPGD